MRTFNEFWELLSPKVEFANRKRACFDLWNSLSENRQNELMTPFRINCQKVNLLIIIRFLR